MKNVLRRWMRGLRPGAHRDLSRRTIVCPCHDVTLHDVQASWAAGYQHPETVKRATAVFMGPCQGKYCAPLAGGLIEQLQGPLEPVGRRPSVRPPLYPVRLGDLAEGPSDDSGARP